MKPPLHRSRRLGRLSKVVVTLSLLAGALTARLAWLNFSGHEQQARLEDLFTKAQIGTAAEVRSGLDLGIDPNSTQPPWPPLTHSYWEEIEIVLGLTRPKPTATEHTLIEVAAFNSKHPDVTKLLLDRGAVPTFEAVSIASNLGNEDVLESLLAHGAPFETPKESALYDTLKSGRPRAVRLLLERGARIPADWETLILWTELREGGDPNAIRKMIKAALAKDPSRLW